MLVTFLFCVRRMLVRRYLIKYGLDLEVRVPPDKTKILG